MTNFKAQMPNEGQMPNIKAQMSNEGQMLEVQMSVPVPWAVLGTRYPVLGTNSLGTQYSGLILNYELTTSNSGLMLNSELST